MKRAFALNLVLLLFIQPILAGLTVTRSSGITLTGADGIRFVGLSGITLTGADGVLDYRSNGITLTGADGITLTGADGITLTGADAATHTGTNGITLTGADGITLTGADGITLTGADGITLTGADGQTYTANTIVLNEPDGITLTGADGITLTGADGITLTGADGVERTSVNGITLTGADGITLTGADGITLTGADSAIGIGPNGVVFEKVAPAGITLTGADGITLTGADGITLTGADGITLTGADGITLTGADDQGSGLQSIDPDLAIAINSATDDSNLNAVIVYHRTVSDADIERLQQLGIIGGTRFRMLPMVYVTGTRQQLIAVSQMPEVRSLWGNRTLTFDSDPYFERTQAERVAADSEITAENAGLAVTGRGVTVAVLDTGINTYHPDLSGKVVRNVRLADLQSVPAGFTYPSPVEGLSNTDPVAGHGTFVAGIIAGSGAASNGKFAGVATGAKVMGLSAGDLNLVHVLSGFDHILHRGADVNTRVVNCSFSSNAPFNLNDPVNIATQMLTSSGVSVVFSAGNAGAGDGTLNPYAAAPWVIGVGATDRTGAIANFSSRGRFGSDLKPSVVAPGVGIASLRSAATTTSVGGVAGADISRLTATELPFYTTASGTSFSAPQVAGAIALMLEARPELTPAEIKEILSRTATPLPKYFSHEAGAGMLNTHAAVLEAAFPERRMGLLRAAAGANRTRFITTTSPLAESLAIPGSSSMSSFTIADNTVRATTRVSWGLGPNDLGLRVHNSAGSVAGESNYLNLPVFGGLRETVTLRRPQAGTYSASVHHSLPTGTPQQYRASLEITRVEMPYLIDLGGVSSEGLSAVETALLANVLLPHGRRFGANDAATRIEFAEAVTRSGLVPQYLFSTPLYSDVRSLAYRNAVESVQGAPSGRLMTEAGSGDRFQPHSQVTKLSAAIAYVRAAGLESTTVGAVLPLSVTDPNAIPLQWRGHVARALEHGFIRLDGTKFNADRPITRLELAASLKTLINR
jgi:serine protease AprX